MKASHRRLNAKLIVLRKLRNTMDSLQKKLNQLNNLWIPIKELSVKVDAPITKNFAKS